MAFDGDTRAYHSVDPIPETRAQALIRQARALIADPDKWLKGAYQIGDAFCIVGALRHADAGDSQLGEGGEAAPYVRSVVNQCMGVLEIEAFNDTLATHADALAALDLAYELAAAQPVAA